MNVHLFLPFPLSVNAMYKNVGKRRTKSKRYVEWLKTAELVLADQYRKAALNGPLMITLVIKQPNRLRRDLGNLEKSVTDLMTGVVYNDDSQIKILAMSFDETDSPVGTRVMIDRLNAPIAQNFLRTFAERDNKKRPDEVLETPAKPDTSTIVQGGQHA